MNIEIKNPEEIKEKKPEETQETKEHLNCCLCRACVPNHWADAPEKKDRK